MFFYSPSSFFFFYKSNCSAHSWSPLSLSPPQSKCGHPLLHSSMSCLCPETTPMTRCRETDRHWVHCRGTWSRENSLPPIQLSSSGNEARERENVRGRLQHHLCNRDSACCPYSALHSLTEYTANTITQTAQIRWMHSQNSKTRLDATVCNTFKLQMRWMWGLLININVYRLSFEVYHKAFVHHK